jgi:hypothetical protein
VVPVENDREPLIPLVPAFLVEKYTEPLEVDVLIPVTRETKAPVALVAIPPFRFISPLVTPSPVDNTIAPETPPTELPEDMINDPVEPEELEPLLKDKAPLIPFVPPFELITVTAPLVLDVPKPDRIYIAPPVPAVEDPALI